MLRLAWNDEGGRIVLEARGWPDEELEDLAGLASSELSQRLAVVPTEALQGGFEQAGWQPVPGSFRIEAEGLLFTPRFPFLYGVSYSLLQRTAAGYRPLGRLSRPARAALPRTRVTGIYPTSNVVPVNLLKLYVCFSEPMSEGWGWRGIQLRREDTGEVVQDAFLHMEPELWDPDRRRLTVLLDPGRIKRGLLPHEEAGYPLIEESSIAVHVDSSWRDATGQPLISSAEQHYRVGPVERRRIDPLAWGYEVPPGGSRERLEVLFGRPLDRALLEHSLCVCDAAGLQVAGRSIPGLGESSWFFEPEQPWTPGRYALLVDPRLEDLAGNSVTRVFDRDLLEDGDTPVRPEPVSVQFVVS